MSRRRPLFWPAMTLTLVSAASMALEIVAGRALAPYVGMSLYTWTIIIAVVLAGLSLGHWFGGRWADRTDHPERAVAVSLAAAALTTLGSLASLRFSAGLSDGLDPIAHISALTLGAFFLPSALAGLISPLLTVIALRDATADRQGSILGLMFALGAFGAIIGTVVAGLVLIAWLGTGMSVALIAGLYALLSLWYWTMPGRSATVLALLIAGTGGAIWPDGFGLRSPCLEESQYFCIRVDPVPGYGREARVMALDHLAHGVNDREDPRLLLSHYVQGVDELIARRFPGSELSVFFVGGGAYTLPRAWQDRFPDGRFTIAELDPAVTEVAKRALWYAPGAETEVLHGDARRVLTGLPEDQRFDVIFGDAFHDISIPQHLVTDEFHAEIADRLNPNGVYVLNVVDALRTPRFMLSLARTLRLRFDHVELWLDRESIQPFEARTTWIVLASDRATGTRDVTAQYGFRRQWVQVPLQAMIDTVDPGALVTLTDDFAPVDRLLSHVLLDADLAEATPDGSN
ncbi:MAG: fused MFS/spermidine synthase [Pseudomonadota bacterium]